MAINADWHAQHPMPPNATLAQRVTWHLAHAEHCGCRPIPETVQAEIRRTARAARSRQAENGA